MAEDTRECSPSRASLPNDTLTLAVLFRDIELPYRIERWHDSEEKFTWKYAISCQHAGIISRLCEKSCRGGTTVNTRTLKMYPWSGTFICNLWIIVFDMQSVLLICGIIIFVSFRTLSSRRSHDMLICSRSVGNFVSDLGEGRKRKKNVLKSVHLSAAEYVYVCVHVEDINRQFSGCIKCSPALLPMTIPANLYVTCRKADLSA